MRRLPSVESQLPLNLHLRDDCTFESYYPGSNAHIINIVRKTIAQPNDGFVYLWGKQGVGCSHLLQAACHYAAQLNQSSFYLPLEATLDAQIFNDLERIDLICLDDLEKIAGNAALEETLFDLYNRIKDAQKKLIIASRQPPLGNKIALKDLCSRLQWGISLHVNPLTDDDLVMALQLRASKRGMQLPKDVAEFIIHRVTRSMGCLYALLAELDVASLKLKRNITIPFVKKVLNL